MKTAQYEWLKDSFPVLFQFSDASRILCNSVCTSGISINGETSAWLGNVDKNP